MRTFFAAALLCTLFAAPARAHGLDDFLSRVNVEARGNLDSFVAKVSAQFEIPEAQVRVVLGAVSDPADAFMVFQIGQYCHRTSDEVLPVYRTEKGKGWGVIAKQLGIKPGSPEFHALKNGDLHFTGVPQSAGPGHGHGHGKGNGNGRGNGNGKP